MVLNIESVAVIGTGPAGIASIYELLHTSKDGTSTVGKEAAKTPKFTKIVGFEQKDKAGGIWAPSFDKADLPTPPQELMDTEKYNNPNIISPSQKIPNDINGATLDNATKAKTDKIANELEWKRSGIFRNLYTNIPNRFTRFSYMENDDKYYDTLRKIYPFLTHMELCNRIDKFIEDENLNDYIRFNSSVKSVKKNSNGKWQLVIKKTNPDGGDDEWYQEEFDGVILANGHFTIPNIPKVPGLAEFTKKNPNDVIHANSYRTPEVFRDQKVLVVGGSISTINVLQYVVPVAKHVTVSSRGNHKLFPWMNKAIRSEGINHKLTMKEIKPNGAVVFSDDSVESKYDKIIYTTGYHFHYPFLYQEDALKVVNPSNSSRVSGLYYNTFSINDPSLAVAGVTCSTLNFHTIESSAAAIAGVWSGASELPSKEDQRKWESERVEQWGNGTLFHYYTHKVVKEEYFDRMDKLMAKGRKSPLFIDGNHLSDVDIGIESIEKLFYKVKTGEYTVKDTMSP